MDVCIAHEMLACSQESELASLVCTAVEDCMQLAPAEQQQRALHLLSVIADTLSKHNQRLEGLWAEAALDVLPSLAVLATLSSRFAPAHGTLI